MKKLAAALLSAMAMAVVPVAITPRAQADVCGDVGGRHVSVGGCTNIAGDAVVAGAVATDDDAAAQAAAGQPPANAPTFLRVPGPAPHPASGARAVRPWPGAAQSW